MSGLGFGMEDEPPHEPTAAGGPPASASSACSSCSSRSSCSLGRVDQRRLRQRSRLLRQRHGHVHVVVHPGDSASAIGRRLADADVVKSSSAFTVAAEANPKSRGIQPGTYQLHHAHEGIARARPDARSRRRWSATPCRSPRASPLPTSSRGSPPTRRSPADALQAALADPAALGLPVVGRTVTSKASCSRRRIR